MSGVAESLTVARSTDPARCRDLATELNARDRAIYGAITT